MRTLPSALLICLLGSAVATAQDKPASAAVATGQERPVNAFNNKAYEYLKGVLLGSAEKMPEESYDFRPTEGVRTFSELLGHVTDAQYLFCSIATGEKNPAPKGDKPKISKADRIAAMRDAFAYCDKAHAGTTKETASQMRKFMGGDLTRLEMLTANNMHTIEHYGNIVTYLRMNKIVPPSTEMMEAQRAKKE